MVLRVLAVLCKDYDGNELEETEMNDWLGIRLMCMSVVVWLLKDYHGNDIEVI